MSSKWGCRVVSAGLIQRDSVGGCRDVRRYVCVCEREGGGGGLERWGWGVEIEECFINRFFSRWSCGNGVVNVANCALT